MGNHDEGEWSPVPPELGANEPVATPAMEERPGVGGPVRVAGLGAVCRLHRIAEDGRSVSYSVSEYALLDDGQRVVLRGDLGFTIGWGSSVSSTSDVWTSLTAESITRDVLNVVLPDDDSGEDHPWEWLAELARDRGLSVTGEDLRGLPYQVELVDWRPPDIRSS